jgi:uncharacterized protein
MSQLDDRITDFLSQKRIAIAGVSRSKPGAASLIYRKFKDLGYQVFALNPNASEYEGDPCYETVSKIPGGVDGVVIVTRPELTEKIVQECAEAGVLRVWMHQSLGSGATSVSQPAIELCKEHSISVIAGACPMMYCQPVDFGHKCMRWLLRLTGGLPE